MKYHEPDMNLTNQINAGLNDVRASLIAENFQRAEFEFHAIGWMIKQFHEGVKVPWSARKPAIDEEFS